MAGKHKSIKRRRTHYADTGTDVVSVKVSFEIAHVIPLGGSWEVHR